MSTHPRPQHTKQIAPIVTSPHTTTNMPRKPGPLLFTPLSTPGDLTVLRTFLSSHASKPHCIPPAQVEFLTQQIHNLLESEINISLSEEKWEGFFRGLQTHPIALTIKVKRDIAELFEEEYDIKKERCLDGWMWEAEGEIRAPKMEPLSPDPSPSIYDTDESTAMIPYLPSPPASPLDDEFDEDINERIERLADLPPVKVNLKDEQRKMDVQIDAMFSRVRKYKKEKGTWNRWRYMHHDIPEEKEIESPFMHEDEEWSEYGDSDGERAAPVKAPRKRQRKRSNGKEVATR